MLLWVFYYLLLTLLFLKDAFNSCFLFVSAGKFFLNYEYANVTFQLKSAVIYPLLYSLPQVNRGIL